MIMTGKGQMPSFGTALSVPKIQELSGYVRRLGTSRGTPVSRRRRGAATLLLALAVGAAPPRPGTPTRSRWGATTCARQMAWRVTIAARRRSTSTRSPTRSSGDPVVLFNRGGVLPAYRRGREGGRRLPRVSRGGAGRARTAPRSRQRSRALDAPPAPVAGTDHARRSARPRPRAGRPRRRRCRPVRRGVVPRLAAWPGRPDEPPPPVAERRRQSGARRSRRRRGSAPPEAAKPPSGQTWIWVAVGAGRRRGRGGSLLRAPRARDHAARHRPRQLQVLMRSARHRLFVPVAAVAASTVLAACHRGDSIPLVEVAGDLSLQPASLSVTVEPAQAARAPVSGRAEGRRGHHTFPPASASRWPPT